MDSILFALWFFLPAGGANVAPIIASRLPYLRKWDAPLDCGKSLRGKRIFGKHKTWRGLFTGVITAIIIVYIQQILWQNGSVNFLVSSSMDYLYFSPVLLGTLFGAGALMGDALESFFKRQRDISSGKSWFPFDQTDYIIGGCIAMAAVIRLSVLEYALILLIWFALHLAFSYLGYLMRLKAQPV